MFEARTLIEQRILEKLRPWQVSPAQHVASLLGSGQNVLDASDTGVGKTYLACAVAAAFHVPTLVCCPKIACSQWAAAAELFGERLSIVGHEALRTGNTPYGIWERPLPPGGSPERQYLQCVICQCRYDPENPQPCHCHAAGIHCIQAKKKSHRYGKFSFHPGIKFLVIDECHRFNAIDSLNADILIAARRARIPTLMLSATPGTSPLHFRALGFCLGLHSLTDYESWARRLGVRRDPVYRQLHWPVSSARQAQVMEDLNKQIFPSRGVRLRKTDIPDFPSVEITAEYYDLEESGKIDEAYREMGTTLAALKARQAQDIAPDSAITIQLRAQQTAELLKVPLFVELTRKYLEAGISIGLFMNFQATIDEIAKRLDTDVIIDGRHTGRRREAAIDAFRANDSRVILVQNAAGGLALSLQDLHGDHPRGGLVSAGFSATVLRQVFGRFPRDSGKSHSFYRVIFAGEIEKTIQRSLQGKLKNLDSLLDSDLIPTDI